MINCIYSAFTAVLSGFYSKDYIKFYTIAFITFFIIINILTINRLQNFSIKFLDDKLELCFFAIITFVVLSIVFMPRLKSQEISIKYSIVTICYLVISLILFFR